jgi:hypothetical protein
MAEVAEGWAYETRTREWDQDQELLKEAIDLIDAAVQLADYSTYPRFVREAKAFLKKVEQIP